jgi:hypothetical protein
MDNAYIDEENAQAICCWDAPDRESIEKIFSEAGVVTESVKEVKKYS